MRATSLRFLEPVFLPFEGGSPDNCRSLAAGPADPDIAVAVCPSILSVSFSAAAVEVSDSPMPGRMLALDFLIAEAASCCIFGAKRIMNARLPICSLYVLIEKRDSVNLARSRTAGTNNLCAMF